MRDLVLLATVTASLSGCALFPPGGEGAGSVTGPPAAQTATDFVPAAASAALGARSASASALDTTTAEEKAAALAAPATGGERVLGTAVVALGPPAEQGLWLSSPFVAAVAQGRVVTAAGQSLAVELRPGRGAALLSLAAFQALKLSLTDLPEVTIYGP
jgi:hypothetical protein